MRKNLKKIVGCMAAMAFVFTSIVPFSVKANTYSNPYTFNYAVGYSGFISGEAEKSNTSSGYIANTSLSKIVPQGNTNGASFSATMFGSANKTGSYSNLVYYGNRSTTYTIYSGTNTYMKNYVKEAGGNYAKIYGSSNGGSYVQFSGFWRADTN